MLPHPSGKIRCGAKVKRAVAPVCHDVDPSAHGLRIAAESCGGNQETWVAGTSPATGELREDYAGSGDMAAVPKPRTKAPRLTVTAPGRRRRSSRRHSPSLRGRRQLTL